jgi:hypothetical protein
MRTRKSNTPWCLKIQTQPRFSSDSSSTTLSSSSSSSSDSGAPVEPPVVRTDSTSTVRHQPPLNIDNPLGIYSRPEREDKINELITLDDGLKEFSELLSRGAIHAAEREPRVIFQDEQDGRNLSEVQKLYLRNETKQGSLKQSKGLLGSLLSTCLAGMIQ